MNNIWRAYHAYEGHTTGVTTDIGRGRLTVRYALESSLSVKTLRVVPGGVETSVFHNTIFPESASVDFSFDYDYLQGEEQFKGIADFRIMI